MGKISEKKNDAIYYFDRKDEKLISYGSHVPIDASERDLEPGISDFIPLLKEQMEQAIEVVERDTGKKPIRREIGILYAEPGEQHDYAYWMFWVEK